MVNKFIGEVDASEAFGAGFTIRLDIKGQAELETEFGEFDFAQKVNIGLAVISAKYIKAFLKVALRQDDKRVKDLPEIPAPLAPIAIKCLDAFCLFREGKDSETLRAEALQKEARGNPTKGTGA